MISNHLLLSQNCGEQAVGQDQILDHHQVSRLQIAQVPPENDFVDSIDVPVARANPKVTNRYGNVWEK